MLRLAPAACHREIELHQQVAETAAPLLGAALDMPVGFRREIFLPYPAPQPGPLPNQTFVADIDDGGLGRRRIGLRGGEEVAPGSAEGADDREQILGRHLRYGGGLRQG